MVFQSLYLALLKNSRQEVLEYRHEVWLRATSHVHYILMIWMQTLRPLRSSQLSLCMINSLSVILCKILSQRSNKLHRLFCTHRCLHAYRKPTQAFRFRYCWVLWSCKLRTLIMTLTLVWFHNYISLRSVSFSFLAQCFVFQLPSSSSLFASITWTFLPCPTWYMCCGSEHIPCPTWNHAAAFNERGWR